MRGVMSLRAISYIFLALFFCLEATLAGEIKATEFAKQLESSGPGFHGLPLRKARVIDIDQNGSMEILLTRNEIEEKSPGFLNTQLYDALAWIDIYSETNAGYEIATNDFKDFLKERKRFYMEWLDRIQNLKDLNQDSISLVKKNSLLFESTLRKYAELASESGS